ncbi:DUF5723 family protein [Fulvivirga maritima]|uniref:DUF5723 family protein n=1 Tax=Fulvivirga maritima TaxID=2904247 RepID=UPI001F379493|nr:DUF5723 family protein [Fulvivirga maritima]UII28917.1 DUF5723 family protein [Fulvivirga maritima]
MVKFYSFFILFIFFHLGLQAQGWLGFHSSNYAGVQGISHQPASIADSRYKFQLNLVSFDAFAANNYYSIPNEDFKKFDIDTDRLIESSKSNGKGVFMASEVYAPFSFLLTMSPKHALAVTARVRMMANVDGVNEDVANFLDRLEDEDGFVIDPGESYDVSDLYVQSHVWAEYGLTYGRVVMDKGDHFLKAGGTFKLLDGIASGYGYVNSLQYDGLQDDRVNVPNVDVYSGFNDEFDEDDFEYKPLSNLGVGFDLGVVYEFRPNIDSYQYSMDGEDGLWRRDQNKYKFRIGLSLLDLGAIKYNRSNDSGHITGSEDNIDVNNLEGDEADIIESLFNFERGGEYTMNLPTRLVGDFDYNVHKGIYLNFTSQIAFKGGSGDLEKTRYVSTVSLTPRWEKKGIELGLPFSYDKFANLNSGFYFRAGPVVLGSRDLVSTYVFGKDPTSANVYFGLRFGIKYKKKKDRDNDGVSNKKDVCPKVPGVWAFKGCPDTDGDGVQDSEDKCPEVAGVAELNGCPDSDGDGVTDSEDECPQVAGLKEFNGCPDTDGDGIKDADDECPEIAGKAEFNGCPDTDGDGVKDSEDLCPNLAGPVAKGGCPDTDGDGIYDNEDKCPNQPGPVENSGCPYADTDGDGVIDAADECVLIPGVPENNGCPAIKEEEQEILNTAFKNLEFESGSNKIKVSSYSALVELANLLKAKPEWRLQISGHTDSQGSAATNLRLSKNRAQAVADFLTEQGLEKDRFEVQGFGETQPITENDTAEGRKQNRRVELEVLMK